MPITYANDPNFFKRFVNLRTLRAPVHHHHHPAPPPRAPFVGYGGGASAAAPREAPAPGEEDSVLPPEEEHGRVAAGAFGVVFSAWDSVTQQKVAIKFSKRKLSKTAWADPYRDEHAQIIEEAYTHAAASRLNCPNILKLLYACEVDVDLDAYIYSEEERRAMLAKGIALPGRHKRHAFVLEYASGHNLRDILANHEQVGTLARVDDPAAGGASGGAAALPSAPVSDRRPYLCVAGAL